MWGLEKLVGRFKRKSEFNDSDYSKEAIAYIAGAKCHELSFGDRVIVTGLVPSYFAGWDNKWISDMDACVGQIGVVARLFVDQDTFSPKGIGVRFRSSNPDCIFRFPHFVLKKLNDKPASRVLNAFHPVLVKQELSDEWKPEFFWKFTPGEDSPYLSTRNISYRYCIPYEGNEHLLGTNFNPE